MHCIKKLPTFLVFILLFLLLAGCNEKIDVENVVLEKSDVIGDVSSGRENFDKKDVIRIYLNHKFHGYNIVELEIERRYEEGKIYLEILNNYRTYSKVQDKEEMIANSYDYKDSGLNSKIEWSNDTYHEFEIDGITYTLKYDIEKDIYDINVINK